MGWRARKLEIARVAAGAQQCLLASGPVTVEADVLAAVCRERM